MGNCSTLRGQMSRIRLPAKLENLHSVMEFVSNFAKDQGFPQKRIREMEIAIEEAVVNVFKYAYPGQPGEVEVRCRMEDDSRLIIEIQDNGIPFDSTSLADPKLNETVSDRKIGGLGVFFIKRMVDEVQYRRDCESNILTFIFNGN
ncbi:MAG: ATP-binding protein [Pseudomonadota bacterium]